MHEISNVIVRHGYPLLFAWVFAEQIGLPLPVAPVLVSAGALAGAGHMRFLLAVAVPLLAAVLCDMIWYVLGRRYGGRVMRLICRISLEPDSCVRGTLLSFERNGPWVLVVAKFVPGVNTVAAPLAGSSHMPWRRFAVFNVLGSTVWAVGYVAVGFTFSSELESVLPRLSYLGGGLFALVLMALGGYVGWKWWNRRRFVRKLRIARITPEELKRRMDAGEEVVVVDLRHALEFDAEPLSISGAVHMDPADLEEAAEAIPRDREIVLFCSCPNEATAAEMALRLRNRGIDRIHPLAEGLDGWRRRGFPMQALNKTAEEPTERRRMANAEE
jgi:membrane protein DedA with SNARE-associated domain/rhodanese-related sulfurtransferase